MSEPQKHRLVRAIERRFGPSILPYRFHHIGLHCLRITDRETGSWVEASTEGKRLRILREHDEAE